MQRQVIYNIRDRIATGLNRQVLTESDKKTLHELKRQMLAEWKTQVFNDSNRKAFSVAKTRILEQVNGNVFGDTNDRVLHDARNRALAELNRRLLTDANRKLLSGLMRQTLAEYARFKLWLRSPVTVRAILTLLAMWTIAIFSTSLALPWSYVGYPSGYGAIIMTALTTARLTVNSQKLWLRHSRFPGSGREGRGMVENGPIRRGVVLHEIEEFLQSEFGAGPRETNLKAEAFLMRKRDWQLLQDALYDTFLRGAPPLLFELGHRLGTSVGRDLGEIGQEPGVVLSHLEEVSRELGWGIFSVHGDLASGAKLTFRVQESPFCVDDSPLEKNTYSCHLVSGLVTGISEEVYGWPCSSFERRCVRDGHEYCEIEVIQEKTPRRPTERWNLSVLFPTLSPWKR
jgi:predicted hydrocarbon binding protein/IS1 family transposase